MEIFFVLNLIQFELVLNIFILKSWIAIQVFDKLLK